MARPFRYEPPALAVGVLRRDRLLRRLEARWERRLVTVVAGPGFGKSVLLASAVAAGAPRGRDVWLGCEERDASAEVLLAGIATALGLTSAASVLEVADHVWSLAPTHVCLILDDVHRVPASSEGAAVLRELLVELPGNGHVVMASRQPVPVATARLAAAGDVERLEEQDLLFDREELAELADRRGVDATVLASSGGWPAVAELMAQAGADLALDFLWEEVLSAMPPRDARLLAALATVGGGDDAVVSAVAGTQIAVEALVRDVPLVHRSADGRAVPHALWLPAARRLLPEDEARTARMRAAAVHHRARRYLEAFDLYGEGGAWSSALAVIRDAIVDEASGVTNADHARWHALLPLDVADHPAALAAAGMAAQSSDPTRSIDLFRSSANGFAAMEDGDAEAAVLGARGLVHWWANDLDGLIEIGSRVATLAASGCRGAELLAAVGRASAGHFSGDSDAVDAALDAIHDGALPAWRPVLQWFRSVARRRDGDIAASLAALEELGGGPLGGMAVHVEVARSRSRWLAGEPDEACRGFARAEAAYSAAGDTVNAVGTAAELMTKRAWLGEPIDHTLSHRSIPVLPGDGGAMVTVTTALAVAVPYVAAGDDDRAATLLREPVIQTIATPSGWYWRDRGALALVHVLVPEAREHLRADALRGPHRVAVDLAAALVDARAGDLGRVVSLVWPEPGLLRTSLPARWAAELVVSGLAAGNPAPQLVAGALGEQLQARAAELAEDPSVSAAVRRAACAIVGGSVESGAPLEIDVLGPLTLRRGGDVIEHRNLQRQRVRELLLLVVLRRRIRREEAAELLWPDANPAHNLRVNLSHLQRVLEPTRARGTSPSWLRSDGQWLSLDPGTVVDAWRLDELLDIADEAERRGHPAQAVAAYRRVLPLWRGEPYAEAPYHDWADRERTRLRSRYLAAARRAGDLLFAAGDHIGARDAADRAIAVDPGAEHAYQLLARVHLAAGDRNGARRVVEACAAALGSLDLRPAPDTLALADG